jgi:hypothetical protein
MLIAARGIKDVAHAHKRAEQEAAENAASEYGPLGAMPRRPHSAAPAEQNGGEQDDLFVAEANDS